MNNLTGGHGHQLMLVVGVIEVVAGIGVFFKPRIFAYVVAAWIQEAFCIDQERAALFCYCLLYTSDAADE